jgi:hypothetical protein
MARWAERDQVLECIASTYRPKLDMVEVERLMLVCIALGLHAAKPVAPMEATPIACLSQQCFPCSRWNSHPQKTLVSSGAATGQRLVFAEFIGRDPPHVPRKRHPCPNHDSHQA